METNGVYVVFFANTGGHFLSMLVDKIRNINSIHNINEETGSGHLTSSVWDGIKRINHSISLGNPENFKLFPIYYDPYIITTHLDLPNIKSIFTHTKFIRIYSNPEDKLFIAKNFFAKQFVENYSLMTKETFSEKLYNPLWKTEPWLRFVEVTYKQWLIKLKYNTVIDPKSMNINDYNTILEFLVEFYEIGDIPYSKIKDQDNLLQIHTVELFNKNYKIIDDIVNFLDKKLSKEHYQVVCDLMDEYSDKQLTFEKMKKMYNVSI